MKNTISLVMLIYLLMLSNSYALDLSSIECLGDKGRAQDTEYTKSKIVDSLINMGKDCIPFLISKLTDTTLLKEPPLCFWSKGYVGDVAFILLCDFFLSADWENPTIPGYSWDNLLETNRNSVPAEQQLHNYIKKHGRKSLKQKWQKLWAKYKYHLYWNNTGRCFKLNK